MFVNIATAVLVSSLLILIASKICSSRKRVPNINEKFVLITGCDSGFGRQAAVLLNSIGFQVFATCLTKEGEEDLKTLCKNQVRTLRLDVTKHDAIEQAYSEVLGTLPSNTGLWGLVNNAGIFIPGPLEWQPLDDFKRSADVNLWGMIDVTKTFLPLVKKAKGRVVNLSSVAGSITATNFASYCVTKSGVDAFSDALRREMHPWGVGVSVIAPGTYSTAILDAENLIRVCHKYWDRLSDEMREAYGETFIQKNDAMLRALCSSASPDTYKVTDALIDALTSSTPKSRYKPGAWPLSWVPWLPTRLGDKVLHLLLKQPVASNLPNLAQTLVPGA